MANGHTIMAKQIGIIIYKMRQYEVRITKFVVCRLLHSIKYEREKK